MTVKTTIDPVVWLRNRLRSEQALVTVIAQAYVEGDSTRRVDDLARAMGIEGISSSEVSREGRSFWSALTCKPGTGAPSLRRCVRTHNRPPFIVQ